MKLRSKATSNSVLLAKDEAFRALLEVTGSMFSIGNCTLYSVAVLGSVPEWLQDLWQFSYKKCQGQGSQQPNVACAKRSVQPHSSERDSKPDAFTSKTVPGIIFECSSGSVITLATRNVKGKAVSNAARRISSLVGSLTLLEQTQNLYVICMKHRQTTCL